MPLYEYFCPECNTTFESLRPSSMADAPVACPHCARESSQRILSLFASSVKANGEGALQSVGVGGGCCGGTCGCH